MLAEPRQTCRCYHSNQKLVKWPINTRQFINLFFNLITGLACSHSASKSFQIIQYERRDRGSTGQIGPWIIFSLACCWIRARETSLSLITHALQHVRTVTEEVPPGLCKFSIAISNSAKHFKTLQYMKELRILASQKVITFVFTGSSSTEGVPPV